MRAKGEDALIGQDVQEAACNRVFGFEIMSAPFVIAHWQVGNLLAKLGAPFDPSKDERPAIFLTNALTGWEPPSGPKKTIPLFPELEHERGQAEHVKRNVPILVVLGNPPYNAFAGTSPEEEDGLVEPYKSGLISKWKIKKFNLDELYVRFLRIAERRIAETSRGLVCFISSYSYLSDPSFVVARESLLNQFDQIWIDCLNGDSRETGKRTPSGDPDPSVFSTRYNRAGIRLGTAVGLFLKRPEPASHTMISYRDFWGTKKRSELLESLSKSPFDGQYEISNPQPWNRLSFRPRDVGNTYLTWPKLSDIAEADPLNGLMEKRGGALIDIDQSALEVRMQAYFDSSVDWATLQLTAPQLTKSASEHNPEKARNVALQRETYDESQLVRYIVRPFDVRYAYYTNTSTIWNRARPDLWTQFRKGNQFLISRPSGVASPEGAPVLFTRHLGDNDAQRGHSYYFPFQIHNSTESDSKTANLSAQSRAWLMHLGLPEPDEDAKSAAAPWHHVLAITYAPQYLNDSADGLAIDWPRVPLPNSRALLENSGAIGSQIAALLDTGADVPGVTSGPIEKHLRILGGISSTDLTLNAGWGSRKSQGRIFPGHGKFEERDWTDVEKDGLRQGLVSNGIGESRGLALLGRAVDVYLNDTTFWRGVPEATWQYVIGGYQVIKKWLSYREEAIMERSLTKNEAREVTAMVRRLTALILLSDKLNANYSACRDNSYDWPSA